MIQWLLSLSDQYDGMPFELERHNNLARSTRVTSENLLGQKDVLSVPGASSIRFLHN